MATVSAELLYDCHCQLGESPTWDERVQRLYFVDINSKKIHIFEPETQKDSVIDAPLMVTTIILTPDPDTLIATLHRFAPLAAHTLCCVHSQNRTAGFYQSVMCYATSLH